MTKNWEISHTLTVIGFIIIIFGIFYNGITINQNKILIEDLNETVKIKNAEIDNLKTKVAEIDTIIANQGSFDKITVGECPPGQEAGTIYIQGNAFTQCN